MRCKACEKNDTTTTVICADCRDHYAAIREGHYQVREVAFGEARLVVHSWSAAPASLDKQVAREARAGKRRGFFGRSAPAAPPEGETPPPPPPDWKNRVFPVPDEGPVGPVFESPLPDPERDVMEMSPIEEAVTPREQGFFETILQASEPMAQPEPTSTPMMAPLSPEPAAVLFDPEPATPEPFSFFEAVEAPVESSPAITGFFETLAEDGAAPDEPAPDLSGFFEALAPSPTAPEPLVAPESPAPSASARGLESFFASLADPVAEAQPVPAPSAEAPLSGLLVDLLASTAADAAPVEAEPGESTVDLAAYFAGLTPVTPPAPGPAAQAPEAPTLDAFFAGLAPEPPAAPAPEAPPTWQAGAVAPAPPARSEERKPFEIALNVPPPPPQAAPPARPQEQAPPMSRQPFSIDLTPPAPPPVAPRRNAESAELKRKHSTGELSFVADEEDEAHSGSLFDGLSFAGGQDDDDDEDRTIEL